MPENFGKFLQELMGDLGLRPAELASQVRRSERTITNWLNAPTPPGESLTLLADALAIPLVDLRFAVKGEAPLPQKYRERRRWQASRAAENKGLTQVRFELAPYDFEALENFARASGYEVDEAARVLMLDSLRARGSGDQDGRKSA